MYPLFKFGGDSMKHQTISFVKSGIRFLGYIMLMPFHPLVGFVLVVSEVIGVVEEIGHD